MADTDPNPEIPVRQIELSNGMKVLVDEFWYPLLAPMKWTAFQTKGNPHIYARRTFVEAGGRRRPLFMHRIIAGAEDGEIVDHRNRNSLDNRTENLRPCTQRQNTQNAKLPDRNTSGYKGVWRYSGNSRKKVWCARLRDQNGRQTFIGSYATAEEAALAYNEAAVRFHGEFAFRNEVGQ
jgi:hypothetical protein